MTPLNKGFENTQTQLELCSAAVNDSTVMIKGTDARKGRDKEVKRE